MGRASFGGLANPARREAMDGAPVCATDAEGFCAAAGFAAACALHAEASTSANAIEVSREASSVRVARVRWIAGANAGSWGSPSWRLGRLQTGSSVPVRRGSIERRLPRVASFAVAHYSRLPVVLSLLRPPNHGSPLGPHLSRRILLRGNEFFRVG